MKIVLLLLSSAMLAVLCYAAFRENVTEFYDYIDSIEKPFNEDKFFKRFEKRLAPYILYDLQALIYFRGNLTVKVAPPPAVSLIVIVPFSIWVNSLAILSPSPKFDLFVWDLSPL